MKDRFETFTVLINKINRNITKIKNQEMTEYNLRSVHISVLYYLYSENSLTARELCDRCGEDKATISRAVDYLESGGYIEKNGDTEKKYKRPLFLTEKGINVGEKISTKIKDVLFEISEEMQEGERAEFYRSLTNISNRLEQISKRKEKR